ncbi:hypothetical protein EMIT0P294_20420 [Pseudomonas sp. IT-P294]
MLEPLFKRLQTLAALRNGNVNAAK